MLFQGKGTEEGVTKGMIERAGIKAALTIERPAQTYLHPYCEEDELG
jgi:hypothetical protein